MVGPDGHCWDRGNSSLLNGDIKHLSQSHTAHHTLMHSKLKGFLIYVEVKGNHARHHKQTKCKNLFYCCDILAQVCAEATGPDHVIMATVQCSGGKLWSWSAPSSCASCFFPCGAQSVWNNDNITLTAFSYFTYLLLPWLPEGPRWTTSFWHKCSCVGLSSTWASTP